LPVVRLGARVLRVPREPFLAWLGIDEQSATNGNGPLPAMLTVEEAARVMRVSRRVAYQLAREYLGDSGGDADEGP
jgi:hypothetical protein